MTRIPTLPPLDVPGLLREHGLHPDKRLGQNFLIDEAALRKIVEAAGISPNDVILEVGPGLGNLTRYLGSLALRVIAVELDADLIPILRHVLAPYPNVQLLQGDILKLDPARLIGEADAGKTSYRVVANIPYYITSALIRHLLGSGIRPQRMVFTLQREVAQRITASAGEMSLLALSIQVYGHAEIAARIPAGAFYPAPKVDSAVLRVDLYPAPLIAEPLLPLFFQLAKAGFSQKRKTLRNALSAGMRWQPSQAEAILLAAGIDPRRRAQTMSLAEWGKLVECCQDALAPAQ